MVQVNTHEAKTHLSKLLDRVARGETVIIAKAGKPVARLLGIDAVSPSGSKQSQVPETPPTGHPWIGRWDGEIRIGEDFDDPLPPGMAEAFGMGRSPEKPPQG